MGTVSEKFQSRVQSTGRFSTTDLIYVVTGLAAETNPDQTALSDVTSAAPASYNNGIDVTYQKSISVNQISNDVWEATVRYGPLDEIDHTQPVTGASVFQFDTGGGTQHITQSLETVDEEAAAGVTPPDFNGTIGVTENGAEGCDITVPVYNFSETHYLAVASVDAAYKGALFDGTGKVNNGTFKGFAAGECLFLGASGTQRGDTDWEITFKFAGSPNQASLVVGGLDAVDKKGWEYIWVHYEEALDATAKRTVLVPHSVYVERVYDTYDFSLLGIGTS